MDDLNDVIAEAAADAAGTTERPEDGNYVPTFEELFPDLMDDAAGMPSDEAMAEEAVAAATDETPAEPAAPSVPDGFSAPTVLADGMATEFTLRDETGDELEIPNVVIEYKANGRVRKDRLDHVVKLAQWGVFNQEKYTGVEQQAQEAQSKAQQLEQVLAEREAQLERLLTDDDFYDTARDVFQQEQSPEARATRAELRAAQLEAQQQWAPVQQEGQRFYEQEVTRAVSMIVENLPSVTEEELYPRIEMALRAHAQPGPDGRPIVLPSSYDAIRQYIVEDLAPWAQVVHVKRSAGKAPAARSAAPAKTGVTPDQIAQQRARRAVGEAMRPVGRVGTPTSAAPKKAPFTLDEAMNDALGDVLSSIR